MELYTAMGADPAHAEFLARTLQVRWEDGALKVHEALMETGPVGMTRSGLLSTIRHRDFSDSRWLGSGWWDISCIVPANPATIT